MSVSAYGSIRSLPDEALAKSGPACKFEQLSSARASQASTSEALHARRVCSFTVSRHQLGVRRPSPASAAIPSLRAQQINRVGSLVPFTSIGGSATDTESEEREAEFTRLAFSKYKCGTRNVKIIGYAI